MGKHEAVMKLLIETPMTRADIERLTGLHQQRVSEVLREVRAQVVGYAPPPNKGRPAPIYSLSATEVPRSNFDALVTAWNWRPV